jgi:hypothetical protein
MIARSIAPRGRRAGGLYGWRSGPVGCAARTQVASARWDGAEILQSGVP